MERLLTPFGENLNKDCPLNDYPRPQLERESFINLNGRWNYAIYNKDKEFAGYQGEIIVPFSPETILSGVEKTVTDRDKLYYQRKFVFKKSKDRVLLHFGAVDYECEVILNGKKVGYHKGGYFPFSFEITDFVIDGENDIQVEVTDPSEKGHQARGKQTTKRGQIWYTPQSGIWQTVWIEEVTDNYIENVKLTPDIDNDCLNIEVSFHGESEDVKVTVFEDGFIKKTEADIPNGKGVIKLNNYKCWSPENPYLYDLLIESKTDTVKSYFGMRKFSVGVDNKGISRLMLNNLPYFHNGLLDQGYWSDGLYTAPTDEAMIYDIKTMKEMGFNMLRKHIKIEPARWYYHCDRIGMLVWQDMVCGGGVYSPYVIGITPFLGMFFANKRIGRLNDGPKNYKLFGRDDVQGREEYYVDAERMVTSLYNVVSIAMWVPFNEGWGQFDAVNAYNFFQGLDNTRTIDHASGWHDQGAGDVNSFHIYFTKMTFPKLNKEDDRPIALTEFGGFSLQAKGHMYNKEKFFGYRKFYNQKSFDEALIKLYDNAIISKIPEGLSAAVYTEVSDVEDECNGLLTFDRKEVKVTMDVIKAINAQVKL